MARTSRAERNRRRESALALVSQGKGFSDVVTAQMSQWGCSRSSAQRECRWAHDQLQLGIESHDGQHLVCHMATSLQRISLKAEEAGFYAPVLITQEDEIITYGSTQVKNLGCNFFGFEDMGNHLSDWDYNDLTARIEVAGVSTLSDIF